MDPMGFGRKIHSEDCYIIQTKYGVLDHTYPTSELMPLPAIVSLNVPEPPLMKVTFHAVSAEESTVMKTAVKCGCKDQKIWVFDRTNVQVTREVYTVVSPVMGPDTECPNI